MKLSFSAIAWGPIKDVSQLKAIVRTVKETGYTGVGIEYQFLPEELKRHPEKIAKIAHDAGLDVPSMSINENIAYMAEAAQKMDAESGWLCLFEKDAAAAAQVTRMHIHEFQKRGVKVALHPHVNSNVESNKQLDDLIEACKPLPLGICFDSAHQEALRMDLPAFIKRYKDKMDLVHLKDLRVRKPLKDINYDTDFADLGDGLVDFPAVMSALKEVRYRGWLMVEVDFVHDTTIEESVQKNFDFLKPLM